MTKTEENLRSKLCFETAGGEKNYSIKAGAGAGKSTLLAKRIARQIKQGENPDHFVIITYTNAAANELRDKISEEISNILSKETLSKDEESLLKDALNGIDLIQISTIHSFLLQILREHSFESKVAIESVLLKDEEDNERKKEFFDRWMLNHDSDLDDFRIIWADKDPKKPDHARVILENMFYDIASLREDIIFDVSDHSALIETKAKQYVGRWLPSLEKFVQEFRKNAPCKKDGNPYKYNKDPNTVLENVDTVSTDYASGVCGKTDALLLSDSLSIINKIQTKDENFYRNGENDLELESYIPVYPKNEMDWNFVLWLEQVENAKRASLTAEYVINIRDAFQGEYDTESQYISNDDILYRAEKLLKNNPVILNELRKKYTKIYVDEFQDTTSCQAEIIKMLSGEADSPCNSFEPKENSLIVVGDPKQSIYRFTGAEKAVYDDFDSKMKSLSPLTESVNLNANFRSNQDIVSWVNDHFSKVISSYELMDTDWLIHDTDSIHGVYQYKYDGDDEYSTEIDAKIVSEIITKLVDNPSYVIEDYDRKESKYSLRKIKYSDFMIITRDTFGTSTYISQLTNDGIPLDVESKYTIGNDSVVNSFINVVKYFANPKNKHDEYSAAQRVGKFDLASSDNSVLENVKSKIENLRKKFNKEGLGSAAIVRRIMDDESLYLDSKKYSIPEIRDFRIKINQMVETTLANNSGSLYDLVLSMEQYLEQKIKKRNPLVLDSNAVRLMNVHQAKGLTANIVIIANRYKREKTQFVGFRSNGKYYPSAWYKPNNYAKNIYPSFGWDDSLMKQAELEEIDENHRLEYVAATRAAYAMIFMPRLREDVWFSNPGYDIDKLPDIFGFINDMSNKTFSNVGISHGNGSSYINLEDLNDAMKTADNSIFTEEAIANINPSLLEPSMTTGYSKGMDGYQEENDRPHHETFGTVMHRVYELIFRRYASLKDLDDAGRNDAIKRIVNQAIAEQLENLHAGDDKDFFATYLIDKMSDYFDKVIVPIAENSVEIYTEYSFSFYVDQVDVAGFKTKFNPFLEKTGKDKVIKTDNIWVNGQADLVVKQKDGKIKVYDYKSDAKSGKPIKEFEVALAEKYKGQLELYKYAIGKAFNVSSVDTEIIHLYR